MSEARIDPVRYVVRFPAPHTHYAEVEATFPAAGEVSIEVFMPVWTPGSYLVREFARHLERLRATDAADAPLGITATRKNRWRIDTAGAETVCLSYGVYCREMSVRTNWVDESFALLNGAATFVTLLNGLHRRHEVRLELPSPWKTSVTGLAAAEGGRCHHYSAPDYDTLVDSPILAGNPALYRFDVDGVPHFVVNEGEGRIFDGPRATADLEKIVRRYCSFFGGLPYTKYVFLNLLTEARGGIEHRNSVCMMASRWATRSHKSYLAWLDLVSHEFLHVWNVKRLRPVELGPFDYENENYTRNLWIAEGFTDYYSFLMVRRTGLVSDAEFLGTDDPTSNSLSGKIDELQNAPGRLEQSLAMASFDAWIKFYRPNENKENTTISYYTKGGLVGWLLDARIRRMTGGAKSLDDLMRLAFARWSGARGYTFEEFRSAAEEVAGGPLDNFFQRNVFAAGELDYTEALDWFGLAFRGKPESKKATLGAETRIDDGRLSVKSIPRTSPVWLSGLNVDDEIIAIDDYRVHAHHLAKRLENYQPDDKVMLLVARRDALLRIGLTLSAERNNWSLEVSPSATPDQQAHFADWVSS